MVGLHLTDSHERISGPSRLAALRNNIEGAMTPVLSFLLYAQYYTGHFQLKARCAQEIAHYLVAERPINRLHHIDDSSVI